MPQIDVTFDIDANGIVNVSAKDKATGKEQQIRIEASGGLSDEEIQNMVNNAEEHATDDKARKELVEARNTADGLVHSAEKSLVEFGDKVPESDKEQIESDVLALKTAMEGEDPTEITEKSNQLAQSSMKLGEAMYKATQEEEAAASGDDSETSENAEDEGEVVDADFEEVDEPEQTKDKAEDQEKKTGT